MIGAIDTSGEVLNVDSFRSATSRIMSSVPSGEGRVELLALLSDVRRARSFLDVFETQVARQLREVSARPEHDVARSARREDSHGHTVATRLDTIEQLPALGAAFDRTDLSGEHVDMAAKVLAGLTKPERGIASGLAAALVDAAVAEQMSPREFGASIRRHVESASEHDRADRLRAQRRATRLRVWDDPATGMVRMNGCYDPVTGAVLRGRLDAALAGLFRDHAPSTCPDDPREKQDHLRALALLAITSSAPAARDESTTNEPNGPIPVARDPNRGVVQRRESVFGVDQTANCGGSVDRSCPKRSERSPGSDGSRNAEPGTGSPTRRSSDNKASPDHQDPPFENAGLDGDGLDGDGLGIRKVDDPRLERARTEEVQVGGGSDEWDAYLSPTTRYARPEIVVVIDATTESAPAIDLGRGPLTSQLPGSALEQLIARSRTSVVAVANGNVVATSRSGPLNLGRSVRLASASQRRALQALYATCAIPNCRVPFAHTQPHHIEWYRNGGKTDLHNLLPLCATHHERVHRHGWQVWPLGPNRELTVQLPTGERLSSGPPSRSKTVPRAGPNALARAG